MCCNVFAINKLKTLKIHSLDGMFGWFLFFYCFVLADTHSNGGLVELVFVALFIKP